ncbi:MAG: hypothetical protein M0D55_05420 [Elusimicrobiota bacterium]|nr:MAG: hypothetical protein M0D55_05420 [Elusimicrobiota bacterium]
MPLPAPGPLRPEGRPPPRGEELSWESFFHHPWPDPLHEKYEDLFGAPFPNRSPQHFSLRRPFSDVIKYDLAFETIAIPGARTESETAAGRHSVNLLLPGSAGRDVTLRPGPQDVTVVVAKSGPARRLRSYRSEERVVPLPPEADPASARLARDGDWLRITFNAKDARRTDGK